MIDLRKGNHHVNEYDTLLYRDDTLLTSYASTCSDDPKHALEDSGWRAIPAAIWRRFETACREEEEEECLVCALIRRSVVLAHILKEYQQSPLYNENKSMKGLLGPF